MNESTALPPPDPPADETPVTQRRLNPVPVLYLAGFVILAGAVIWLWQNPPLQPTARIDPTQFAALQQQVQGLEQRIAKVEQRPVAQPTDLKPLEQRVVALEQRPAPKLPDVAPLDQRITALEKRPQVPADVATRTDLAALGARMDALAGREDQLATRSQGLETTFGNRMDQAASQIAALQHASAGLSGLAGQMQATDKRVDVVEKQAGQVSALADKAGRIGRIQAARAALDAGQPLGDIPGAPPPLTRFAQAKPPTEAALRLSFPTAARAAEVASRPSTDGKPFLDRVWVRAQDLVTVREGDRVIVGDPAAGVIARARTALMAGDLTAAVAALNGLSGAAAQAMADWKGQASALLDARAALASMAAGA